MDRLGDAQHQAYYGNTISTRPLAVRTARDELRLGRDRLRQLSGPLRAALLRRRLPRSRARRFEFGVQRQEMTTFDTEVVVKRTSEADGLASDHLGRYYFCLRLGVVHVNLSSERWSMGKQASVQAFRTAATASAFVLVACAASSSTERVDSRSDRLGKVGVNWNVTPSSQFGAHGLNSTSVVVLHHLPSISFQDDDPTLASFWARSWVATGADGTPPSYSLLQSISYLVETPSYPALFNGYSGRSQLIAGEDGFSWVSVGVTGAAHLATEVVVRHVPGPTEVHVLTKVLNPAYYPHKATSGGIDGYPISGVAAVSDPANPKRVWVMWSLTNDSCDPDVDSCTKGYSFLTRFDFDDDGGNYHQGPSWELTNPSQGLDIARWGQAVMIATAPGSAAGCGPQLAVAWPDKSPICNYQDVRWRVSSFHACEDVLEHATGISFASEVVAIRDPIATACVYNALTTPGDPTINFQPTMFRSSEDDSLWVGAPVHIIRNNIEYGTRIVVKNGSASSFPLTGTYATCNGHARINEGDTPGSEVSCDQWAPSSAVVLPPGSAHQAAMMMWHEAGDHTKRKTAIMGATFTPLAPLDFNVFDVSVANDSSEDVPWVQTNPTDYGPTPWGRFDGIGVDTESGEFVAAWSDNRRDLPGQRTRVFAARITP